MQMTSTRPYLIRAIYDWISDNDLTAYILVNAQADGVKVPEQFVEHGKIILNISAQAVSCFEIDNEWLSFSARFSGVQMNIVIPTVAVLAIYARENGQGMVLEDDLEKNATDLSVSNKPSRPHLRVVK